MATGIRPRNLRIPVVISLIFGTLGGAFYWWVPMGMVMSLAGLVLGFVDWTQARRRSLNARLSVVTMLLSVVTLSFGIAIAFLGLQTVTFSR